MTGENHSVQLNYNYGFHRGTISDYPITTIQEEITLKYIVTLVINYVIRVPIIVNLSVIMLV